MTSVLIVGSRSLRDPVVIERALEHVLARVCTSVPAPGTFIACLLYGDETTVDQVVAAWVERQRAFDPRFVALRYAGATADRTTLVQLAACLVALWDGTSPGVLKTIEHARGEKKPVFVHDFSRTRM